MIIKSKLLDNSTFNIKSGYYHLKLIKYNSDTCIFVDDSYFEFIVSKKCLLDEININTDFQLNEFLDHCFVVHIKNYDNNLLSFIVIYNTTKQYSYIKS